MEQSQSSFIPKKAEASGFAYRASGGVFSFIASLIFIVAVTSSVGVFVYGKYLSGRIANMENDLTMARQSLQPDLIKELSRSDARIISARELIDKHITLSAFFEFLQTNTLQSVRFNSFSFQRGENNKLTVLMKGEARTYATVALQASVFSGDSNLVNPQFSDLDLNEEGMVVFSLKTEIDPRLISYREQFRSLPPLPVEGTLPVSPVEGNGQVLPTDSTSVAQPGVVDQTN